MSRGHLTLVTQPGAEPWEISDHHAEILTRLIGRNDVVLEYVHRNDADVVFARDLAPNEYPKKGAFGVRGYSRRYSDGSLQAVVFVDDLEDYPSALFVACHELAHLTVRLDDDDEEAADLIAASMMEKLGYRNWIYEAGSAADHT